jgi:2-polyprenyl-3-methyl-5-hydroxy-6-metoxy-1,4-benzoquinol methylase
MNRDKLNYQKYFSFGQNWSKYLSLVDEDRILEAEKSLKHFLGIDDLSGKTFLDIGSGSGLFSLAAKRLGANVTSFDYDPKSVACTQHLKSLYFKDDITWRIEEGSVLDLQYLETLGKFDIVYSWGVLHHTGSMWNALENIIPNVGENGKLFIALYNHQPFATTYWTFIKRSYNRVMLLRPLIIFIHLVYPTIPMLIFRFITNRKSPRGMSVWYDLIDWLGGYPFEVATPEAIFYFYKDKNFNLKMLKTVGGRMGCNEFVFQKNGI